MKNPDYVFLTITISELQQRKIKFTYILLSLVIAYI